MDNAAARFGNRRASSGLSDNRYEVHSAIKPPCAVVCVDVVSPFRSATYRGLLTPVRPARRDDT